MDAGGLPSRRCEVVGDGIEGGSAVMPTSQALRLAREQELDLIEISPKAEPPVVRIADYQKFLLPAEEEGQGAEGEDREGDDKGDTFRSSDRRPRL